jgi:hypothetical protein
MSGGGPRVDWDEENAATGLSKWCAGVNWLTIRADAGVIFDCGLADCVSVTPRQQLWSQHPALRRTISSDVAWAPV